MPRIPNDPTNRASKAQINNTNKELDSKTIKRLQNEFFKEYKKAGFFSMLLGKFEGKPCFYVFAAHKHTLEAIRDDFKGVQVIKKLKPIPSEIKESSSDKNTKRSNKSN